MDKAEHVRHLGIVTNCYEDKATVQLVNPQECETCYLKGICGVDDEERSRFVVPQEDLHVGDEVSIEISPTVGFRALFWAYMLPFLLMMFVLVTGLYLKIGEQLVGALSLFILIPYYLILSRFRPILKSHLDLTILKHG